MGVTIRDELRLVGELRPHPRNYNRHTGQQVEQLAEAMAVTAFTAPIICRDDGTILGGHLRQAALLRLRDYNAASSVCRTVCPGKDGV